jgi:hypothetical protein
MADRVPEVVLLDHGVVAEIRLSRVRARNALSTGLAEELLATAGAVRDTAARAVVLSSAAPEAFGTQTVRSLPGGPVRTVGTYSTSWSLPSNVRLATISRPTSGYPS